jgi:hypothetical protein
LNLVIGIPVVIVLVLLILVPGQRLVFGPSASKEAPQDQQSKQEAPKDQRPKEVQ